MEKYKLSQEATKKLADNVDAAVDMFAIKEDAPYIGEEVVEAWCYWPGEEGTAKEAIKRMLEMKSDILGVRVTEPEFTVTDLNDQRITVPPAEMDKWHGCKVMLGAARIKEVSEKYFLDIKGEEFLASLGEDDLAYLRGITREVGRRYGYNFMSDERCDEIIKMQGPETANKILAKINR